MSLTTEIKEYAREIGIDDIKVTTAQSFPKLKDFLGKMSEQNYLSKFVKDDLDLITNPRQTLAEAKSVIVCAISYAVDEKYIRESKEKVDRELKGKLSRFAWGEDYHQVLGGKLDKLIEFLQAKRENIKAKKFVDTGPTVDRALARRAGIGWQGKNCSIINPEYGSWIFLGGIITNLELEIDNPVDDKCGSCSKCIEACPTGALEDGYTLDSRKCLGYITLSRGYIDEEYRTKMEDRLWGCDTCQEVCPHNQQAKIGEHPEFRPQKLDAYPELTPLLQLTNKSYKELFKITPMNWRGKRPIQRNAAIIMGNLKDEAAIPELIRALSDPKPIVRAHSAWALGKIEDDSVIDELQKAKAREKDERVKLEIEQAIDKLED